MAVDDRQLLVGRGTAVRRSANGAREGTEEAEGALFRFPLHPAGGGPKGPDPQTHLVREQLRNLLSVVRLLEGSREVDVDGFRFLGPDGSVHEIYTSSRDGSHGETGRETSDTRKDGSNTASHPNERSGGTGSPSGACGRGNPIPPFLNRANAALYEPRLDLVARQLESLLSLVQLECEGQPVEVDGFRLRRLSDWADAPVGGVEDVILHAADRCDCQCRFCYNRGSPPSLQQPPADLESDWKRLEARVAHYRPLARRGLFPSFGGPREALAHPKIIPLLRRLRECTDAPFRLATNGCRLDRAFIEELAGLAPLFLDVSLNSSDPVRRSFLMGDRNPETAISALPRLAEVAVPFAVTVVAWPEPSLEEMLRDLKRTCAYAAGCGARLIQVNLPGYSRFFSPRPLFDTDEVWGAVVRLVQEMRGGFPCPLVLSPALYEENLTRERKNLPEVIGLVPNSPATTWGLRAGDVILRLNGINVLNRPQARDLLTLLQESGERKVSLLVERDGKAVELGGETRRFSYPFDFHTGTHLGVVFMGSGLRVSYLRDLEAMVRRSGARLTLFLTSRLVHPTLRQLLEENPLSLPEGAELRLSVPENRFFGGNIMLGDLLVVEDFIDHLREWVERHGRKPDLVIIPSSPFSLSRWGRDLTGRVYLDIARETGLEVELLRCETVMD